ncbi:MAG: polysaccharide biosynthesis protein [Ignavibacteriota bacterium]
MTGAGGFIGSALVRAIAAAAPSRLVLLDSCEQNLFEISQHVPAEAVLGSVTDAALLDDLLLRFRPRVVFHAAAYKHVPLLESNPFAAIHNNAIGTFILAETLLRHSPSRLVLVSTDKAVNPRSIMGASKRFGELTMASLSTPACPMNAVRLGNVIASTGSVIPIFRRQIAAGGTVTVTHREATRYFISLDAAVESILAAGAVPCSGRILIPDLGTPVRIEDLARSMIGDAPLPIHFTGLRPGDKLSEELTFADEVQEGTTGPLSIYRTRSLDVAVLRSAVTRLCDARTPDELFAVIGAVVCP